MTRVPSMVSVALRSVATACAALLLACGGSGELGAGSQSVLSDSTRPPEALGKVMLCKVPPGNPGNAHTIVVAEPAVESHLKNGSYLGPCEAPRPACGDDDVRREADRAEHHLFDCDKARHRGVGRDKGPRKVAVCHIPPGNPANAHTIVVGEPAVRAHLAHGDLLGFCSVPQCGGHEPPPPAHDDCDDPGPADAPGTDPGDGRIAPLPSPAPSPAPSPLPEPSSCPSGLTACAQHADCGGGYCYQHCCLDAVVY